MKKKRWWDEDWRINRKNDKENERKRKNENLREEKRIKRKMWKEGEERGKKS